MRVLVFGAHPDDMEIGMGGTIAKHVDAGDDILMVVCSIPSQREVRLREAREAAEVIGAPLELLDIPSDNLGFNRDTIRECDRLFTAVDPHLVYTHWDQDSHQDHNAISRSVIAAARLLAAASMRGVWPQAGSWRFGSTPASSSTVIASTMPAPAA